MGSAISVIHPSLSEELHAGVILKHSRKISFLQLHGQMSFWTNYVLASKSEAKNIRWAFWRNPNVLQKNFGCSN